MQTRTRNPVEVTDLHIERFWDRVEITEGCWWWTGAASGYGHMRIGSAMVRAHRLSFFLAYGEWPEPQCLHSCDQPLCVNPAHLRSGDQAENLREAVAKGRKPGKTGLDNPMAKLSPEQVAEIRRRAGTVTQQVLADEFGVTQSRISQITNQRSVRCG